MAVYSQNGYKANDRSLIKTYTVNGIEHSGKVAVREGDVATVLLWILRKYDREVQPLHWPGVWGYAERDIRGSTTTLSNHASGTAVDADADDHPLGTSPSANYTAAQIREIHHILAYTVVDGVQVVRWGGDYTGRKDGMHFEINASPTLVAKLAAKILGLNTQPVVSTAKRPVQKFQGLLEFLPANRTGNWGPGTDTKALHMRVAAVHVDSHLGSLTPGTVKWIQKVVDVKPDGVWGDKSRAGMKTWVKSLQLLLNVKQTGEWGEAHGRFDEQFLAFRKQYNQS